jgi:hypothetical protein
MKALSEEDLDRLLTPKAIDPHRVAAFLQQYVPECAQSDLLKLVKELVALGGHQCVYQAPYERRSVRP